MRVSEKRFLEELADRIPGVKGYREKEHRRDTDKRLRESMASELDRARERLVALQKGFVSAGKLDIVGQADGVSRKLQRAADALRYASYGYSGFFDQLKVREEELERLYDYDSAMLANIKAVRERVEVAQDLPETPQALKELEAEVETLIATIDRRKQLFDRPDGD